MKKSALLGILLAVSTGANAGVITTYSDRATFDAAVGTTTLESFTSDYHFPIPGGSLSSTSSFIPSSGTPVNAGDIKAGATYTTPVGTGYYFNIDGSGGFEGGFLDGFQAPDRDLTITYNPLIAAFGFDTNGFMDDFDVTINFLADPSYTSHFSFTGYGLQFFGFKSEVADIQSVVISGNGSAFGFAIDNHAFGGATSALPESVPEPATLALLGLGFLGLGMSRRKKTA